MNLTDEEKKMYDGNYGLGVQRAMNMLVKYGNTFNAERMIKVHSCHLFATDPLEFVRYMLEEVEEVRAFTTLNCLFLPGSEWSSIVGIPAELAQPEIKSSEERVNLLRKLGSLAVFSCAPYLVGNILRKNLIFSWPGSSGIIIANSIFGARGNRDASAAALCSAITGVTPEMLLHKPENRNAELIVYLEDLNLASLSEADFGALGYSIGSLAGSKNVALMGNFPPDLSFEKMKYLLSPMPVSGAVSLCHIIGVTPEAPTLEAVLVNGNAKQTAVVGRKELEVAHQKLNNSRTNQVDVVCLGCPHGTISEIRRIAQLIDGKRVREGVQLWVSTADGVYSIAKRMGYVNIIESAKGQVFKDICIMNIPSLRFPHLRSNVKSSATNSARCSLYQAHGGIWGGEGLDVFYGTTEQCIAAAITGRWEG